jgi:hypothetical protein
MWNAKSGPSNSGSFSHFHVYQYRKLITWGSMKFSYSLEKQFYSLHVKDY